MKFTKVVILASALAVSSISLSGLSHAADSQTIVLSKADEDSKAKADGLQINLGKYCRVHLSGERSKDFFEGNLKSATRSWLILENETEKEVDGKTAKVKFQTYLPMNEVGIIYFSPPPIG